MTSLAKQLCAAFLGVILSLGLWLLILSSAVISSTLLAVAAGISVFIWLTYIAVVLAVATQKSAVLILVLGIPITVVAVAHGSLTAVGAAIVMIALLAASYARIRGEVAGRIKHQTVAVFRGGVSLLVLVLLLAVIGILVPQLVTKAEKGELDIQLPEQTVMAIVRPFAGMLERLIPGYTHQASVNDLISTSIASKTQGSAIPPAALEQQRSQVRASLAAYLGQPIQGNETVPVLVTKMINNQITRALEQNQLVVTLLGIGIVLLIARVMIPVIVWPTLGLIAMSVITARRMTLLHITLIPSTVEQLQI